MTETWEINELAETYRVTKISKRGVVVIAPDGAVTTIKWPVLRSAIDQADPDLRRVYRSILHRAEKMACELAPEFIHAAETNTNVYGVVGIGIDGTTRPIRAYKQLRLLTDEGLNLYVRVHAEAEAGDIRKRNPQ
jgi:hypothetical protein